MDIPFHCFFVFFPFGEGIEPCIDSSQVCLLCGRAAVELRFSLLFVRVLQAQPQFDCSISSVIQRNKRFKLVNGASPRTIDERAPFPKIHALLFAFTQFGCWIKLPTP